MSSNGDDGASNLSTAGAVSFFTSISEPILRSVDPVMVAKFLKERERYELEIAAKNTEVPTLKVLPYNASIYRSLLKNLLFMGNVDDIAPTVLDAKDLTNENIKTYVKSLVSSTTDSEINPSIIERALEGFTMPTHIVNADTRVTHFCADFFERLEVVGNKLCFSNVGRLYHS